KKARIYEGLRDLNFEFRVGKLSDEDYQTTKLGLQKDLAGVLAEIDALTGGAKAAPVRKKAAKPKPDGKQCPHCGAKFENVMKFCGECGKAMRP
ncbi:MAG: zinc ribbon domain-containing protein, partial [bacterium]|nr:zinc ribbon domain-containing protein [bacterium]